MAFVFVLQNAKVMSHTDDSNKDFPGYPHYPSGEDITNNKKKQPLNGTNLNDQAESAASEESENDINAEDLAALEQEDRNIVATNLDDTDEDGTPLNENADIKDMGADLDVPGAELDDVDEAVGEEDEENNYYSLGDNDTSEDIEGIP